jgi:hypothetical protein
LFLKSGKPCVKPIEVRPPEEIKVLRYFLIGLVFELISSSVSACPFCSENLAKNSGGFAGGLTLGITITIFLMLGTVGLLAGFIIYQIIQGDKRRNLTHSKES